MLKAKTGLVLLVTLTLAAACGPKSRYRAKDFNGNPLEIMNKKDPKGEVANSPVPADLGRDLKNPDKPETPASIALENKQEFIGATKSEDAEGNLSINLFLQSKSEDKVSTRLIAIKGKRDDLAVSKIGQLNESDVSTELKDEQVKVTTGCLNDKCSIISFTIENDGGKFEARAEFKDETKTVVPAKADDKVDEKLEKFVGEEIRIHRTVVFSSSKRFDTLTIVSFENKPLVLALESNKSEAQKLGVLYGRHLGIEAVDFIGNSETFELTIKGKDDKLLAKLDFKPVVKAEEPAATPSTPAAGTPAEPTAPAAPATPATPVVPTAAAPSEAVAQCGTNENTFVKLVCFKQVDEKDQRIADTFAVKAELAEGVDATKIMIADSVTARTSLQNVSLQGEGQSKVISSLDGKTLSEIFLSLEGKEEKASIKLNDVCCKENLKLAK